MDLFFAGVACIVLGVILVALETDDEEEKLGLMGKLASPPVCKTGA